MAQAATAQGYSTQADQKRDIAESVLNSADSATERTTGISLFHLLTFGSIGASVALFLSGRKMEGIFVGLWAPTFEALKSASDRAARKA